MTEISEDSQRIDIWLFRTRLFKTRADAGAFVEMGKVRLERAGQVRKLARASATVRPGDTLVYIRHQSAVRVTVLGLGERRGPAPEARGLYEIDAPGRE